MALSQFKRFLFKIYILLSFSFLHSIHCNAPPSTSCYANLCSLIDRCFCTSKERLAFSSQMLFQIFQRRLKIAKLLLTLACISPQNSDGQWKDLDIYHCKETINQSLTFYSNLSSQDPLNSDDAKDSWNHEKFSASKNTNTQDNIYSAIVMHEII